MKDRDLSFEALATTTSTDWNVGRGELNAALGQIREQMPGVDDVDLAAEIVWRASLYRKVFAGVSLTPTALAKHWLRVVSEQRHVDAPVVATNQWAEEDLWRNASPERTPRPAWVERWQKARAAGDDRMFPEQAEGIRQMHRDALESYSMGVSGYEAALNVPHDDAEVWVQAGEYA